MAKVKVRLLRPLNGEPVGKTVSYDEADAKRLAGYGAVEIVKAKPKAAPTRRTQAEGGAARTQAERGTRSNKAGDITRPARSAR